MDECEYKLNLNGKIYEITHWYENGYDGMYNHYLIKCNEDTVYEGDDITDWLANTFGVDED